MMLAKNVPRSAFSRAESQKPIACVLWGVVTQQRPSDGMIGWGIRWYTRLSIEPLDGRDHEWRKKIDLLQAAGKCVLLPEKVQSSSSGIDKDGDSTGQATRFDVLAQCLHARRWLEGRCGLGQAATL